MTLTNDWGAFDLEIVKFDWLLTAKNEGGRRVGKWSASTERRPGLARDSNLRSRGVGGSNLGKFDAVVASIEEIHHSLNSVGVESIRLERASLCLLAESKHLSGPSDGMMQGEKLTWNSPASAAFITGDWGHTTAL